MSEIQSLNTTLLVFGTIQDMSDSQVNEPRKDIYSRICSCLQNIYVIQKLMYNMHVKKVHPYVIQKLKAPERAYTAELAV